MVSARLLSKYISVCCFLFAISLDGTVYAAPGPEQLMQKAEAYFMRFEHFRGTWIVTSSTAGSEVRGEGKKWEILKDGRKVKVIAFGGTPPKFTLPPGAEKASKRELEQLREKHRRRYLTKEFITIPGESNLRVYDRDVLLNEVDPTRETANRIIGKTPFALYYGYLEYEPILDLLKSLDLSAGVSELDGSEMHVLHGKARDGTLDIQVWLDPNLEYVIRKIEYQRRRSDPGVPDRYGKVIHKQTNFRKVDGVLIPMKAERTLIRPPMPTLFREGDNRVTRKDASGNVIMRPAHTTLVVQELQSFDYEPAFVAADFKPSVPIEEGAPVQMTDARQLQHEWKDGEAVPVAPDTPTGSEFIKNDRPTARLLMVFTGIVLIFFVAVMLHRRQKHE
jgi:hypothetical protein